MRAGGCRLCIAGVPPSAIVVIGRQWSLGHSGHHKTSRTAITWSGRSVQLEAL